MLLSQIFFWICHQNSSTKRSSTGLLSICYTGIFCLGRLAILMNKIQIKREKQEIEGKEICNLANAIFHKMDLIGFLLVFGSGTKLSHLAIKSN